MGHVAVVPDQMGLVAADNRTRANHTYNRGISIRSALLFCCQNSQWLEPAPCCCRWA